MAAGVFRHSRSRIRRRRWVPTLAAAGGTANLSGSSVGAGTTSASLTASSRITGTAAGAGTTSGAIGQKLSNFDVQTLTNHARPVGWWHPYAEDSPFNTPIVSGAATFNDGVRTSASIISYLSAIAAQPSTLIFNAGGTTADFGHPHYYAKSTDDLVTIDNRYDTTHGGAFGGNFGAAETQGLTYRVPHAALPAGTFTANVPNQDGHMHVVQPDGTLLTMYKVETGWTDGGTLFCRWSALEPISGDGVTRPDLPGSTAAFFAGDPVVRTEELNSRIMQHALMGTTFRVRSYVYPARGNGTQVTDLNAPPMGARLRYVPDEAAIDAQSWATWVKDWFKVLHKYGMYISDTGGASTDALTYKVESDQVYRSFPSDFPTPFSETWAIANSVPSRVSGSLARTVYELISSNYTINISDFEVIQPPVAFISGTAAGAGTTSGTVSASGTAALTGTSAGVGTTTGAVTARALITGTSAGVGTTVGALTATALITGTSAGAGTTTGALTASSRLTGTSAGAGTTTALLTATALLTGSSTGAGTTSGVLTATGPALITGTSAGVGTTTGALTATDLLSGTSTGAGTTTGALTATALITGTSAGAGTTTGALTASARITGTTAGAGTVSGALTASSLITGTSTGVGTTSGTVTVPGAALISGTSAGVGTTVGALTASARITGTSTGAGTTTGAPVGIPRLLGTVTGAGTVSATLKVSAAVAGTSSGVGSLVGAIRVTANIIATAAGLGSASGQVTIFGLVPTFLHPTGLSIDIYTNGLTIDAYVTDMSLDTRETSVLFDTQTSGLSLDSNMNNLGFNLNENELSLDTRETGLVFDDNSTEVVLDAD